MSKNPWTTVKENKIYENKFGYTLWDNDVITPAGKPGKFMLLEHYDFSVIVPVTKDGQLVLVKQWRYSMGKQTLELPSGGGEKGEDPENVAKRELMEETGGHSNNWKLLNKSWTANGCARMRGWYYLAQDVELENELHNDETESTEAVLVPFEKAVQMAINNEFEENRTIMAILLAREEMTKHR